MIARARGFSPRDRHFFLFPFQKETKEPPFWSFVHCATNFCKEVPLQLENRFFPELETSETPNFSFLPKKFPLKNHAVP